MLRNQFCFGRFGVRLSSKRGELNILLVCTILFGGLSSCQKATPLADEEYDERLSGGSQTVFDAGGGAFSHPFPNLSARNTFNHDVGDGMFESTFITAPAINNPGLGPLFNNVSCVSCHVSDGRGKPPANSSEMLSSMLIRISVAGASHQGGPNHAPGFGGQIQPRAVFGSKAEAEVHIDYEEITEYFEDGTPYTLRKPIINVQNPHVPLPAGYMLSARVARPVFGLGLLEAIDENEILANADEQDTDSDGISGKANQVWDIKKHGTALGRFGWKAGQPSVLQQVAFAFNEDIGITNYLFPEENNVDPHNNLGQNHEVELSDSLLTATAFYMRSLAVPARRNVDDPKVQRGKEIFAEANCKSCHVPLQHTGTNVAYPEVSNQVIFPYTDLLLHAMGDGLADYRSEYEANGFEWRTPPLWGIGLTEAVNGHNNFLHDGRARSLLEAVLWHGGEAQKAKNIVKKLNKSDREALEAFLKSL